MSESKDTLGFRSSYLKEKKLTAQTLIDRITEYNQNRPADGQLPVPSLTVVNRWGTNFSPSSDRPPVLKLPPLDTLVFIAHLLNTNVSYLLYQTEIAEACENYEIKPRLKSIQEYRKLNTMQYANLLGLDYTTMLRILGPGFKTAKIKTLVSICSTLDCSLDYLLGLSNRRHFDIDTAFIADYPPGSALCIKTEDEEKNCLLSMDKKTLIFADGTTLPTSHPLLYYAQIRILQ